MNSSVVMILGTAYVDWIQIEFPQISVEFNEQDQLDYGLIKSETNNNNKGAEIDSKWEKIDEIYKCHVHKSNSSYN